MYTEMIPVYSVSLTFNVLFSFVVTFLYVCATAVGHFHCYVSSVVITVLAVLAGSCFFMLRRGWGGSC